MFAHFGSGPGQSAELLLDELAKKSRTIGGDRAKNGAEFRMDWRRGLSVLVTEVQQSGDSDCSTLPETA